MKPVLFLLLFCLPFLLTAQCKELKKTLENKSSLQNFNAWKVTIKEIEKDLFQLVTNLEYNKQENSEGSRHNFIVLHYGFEVVDCNNCMKEAEEYVSSIPFDSIITTVGKSTEHQTIVLRKIKGVSLYGIQAITESSIHYSNQPSCGCSFSYNQYIPLLFEDPLPRTIIVGRKRVLSEYSDKKINCSFLH